MSNLSTKHPINPLNIHYALEIDGVQWGIFESISGGEMQVEVIQHNVVYENGGFATLQIPGPSHISPIVLESGYGNTADLYQWFTLVKNGDIAKARKNATISLNAFVEGRYQPVIQWHLIGVWPSQISGIHLEQAHTREARFSMTLVAETIEREDLAPIK